jgi:EmrB/QacA subfamily drug resistance transporter
MSPARRRLTVVAVLLSAFMAAMEATVVATAMPTVVGKLGGLELYGWVGSIYLVASTVVVPLNGKLADVYGRKPVMLAGIFFFLAGSVASGLSATMTQLIVFRALQGIGAGAMQPISLTIVGDLYRPEERAKIQGVFGAVWGLAGMIGPLLGGLIVRVLSWRWVFFVNVPFGLLSGAILAAALHERVAKKEHTLDVLGAGLLAASIVSLLLGVSGGAWMLTLPSSFVLLVAFVLVEKRSREPILPLDLLTRRVLAVSSLGGVVMGSVMMSTVIYVPLYVQGVLQGSPTEAGTTVAPMLVGWPLASAASGRILPRVGYRPLVRTGFVVIAISSACLAWLLRPGGGTWPVRTAMLTFGAGLGLANTALLIAVQESVDWAQRGVATASTMFFRSIGGGVAVGALGAVLAAALGPGVSRTDLQRLMDPRVGGPLDPSLLARIAGRLEDGLARIFVVIAIIAVAGAVVAFFFPKAHVKSRAGASATPTPRTEAEAPASQP